MTDWQPLSVRRGIRPIPELTEGVPTYLNPSLRHWLEGQFGYRSGEMRTPLMMQVALLARITAPSALRETRLMTYLLDACEHHSDTYLEVLDATLAQRGGSASTVLKSILTSGNSAWTVSADGLGLERRVDATATEAFRIAASPMDAASMELADAWSNAYGLDANPSDAWDHAIKAMEEILIPRVVPLKDKANLGAVIGELRANPTKWTFILHSTSSSLTPVGTLEGMLRLAWPNPDRHGGPERRTPTVEEARGVVHLAVLVVQWVRDSALSKA